MAQTKEAKEEEMITIPKAEYEIILRQAQCYQMLCARESANQQLVRLEAELRELSK
jgi:hypothetical protein